MREIKFRLRIGDKIVGYERIKPNEDGYLISTYSFDNSIGGWIFKPIEHKDKDQFIGLKDKNGKEIYEGDIVKGDYHWIKPIKVELGAAFFYEWVEYGEETLEVIGNIYKNPELFEKEVK